MTAKGITPGLLALRAMEVQEAIINAIGAGDVATFVVPYGLENSLALQNRVYAKH